MPSSQNADPTRALSIRHPWAELILRAIKTIEVRSLPTKIRERVFIYASLGRYSEADESNWAEEFDLSFEDLSRGVLVGTVKIAECRPLKAADSKAACFEIEETDGLYSWCLSEPARLATPIKPAKHPQPVWFNPF